jgi:hypothetical protein
MNPEVSADLGPERDTKCASPAPLGPLPPCDGVAIELQDDEPSSDP